MLRMEHCGRHRDLNAFIFRDWWTLRSRFEFDLKELCKGVPDRFGPPPDKPLPLVKASAPRAAPPPASMSACTALFEKRALVRPILDRAGAFAGRLSGAPPTTPGR